jgi:hypothetical protein
VADLKVEIAARLRHGDFGGPGYGCQQNKRQEAKKNSLHVIFLQWVVMLLF